MFTYYTGLHVKSTFTIMSLDTRQRNPSFVMRIHAIQDSNLKMNSKLILQVNDLDDYDS